MLRKHLFPLPLFSYRSLYFRCNLPKHLSSAKFVEIEVKDIKEETIKPSSSTPHHLRTFKLSSLDQIYPAMYVPFVFFYSSNDHNHVDVVEEKLARLKDSLAKVLTELYPLAGRIQNDQTHVDCNDQGALYIEAKLSCSISSCLNRAQSSQMELVDQLLPCQQFNYNVPLELTPQIAIKANIFTCGGIAIGICVLHKLIDGITLNTFLQTWAKINHGTWSRERFRVDGDIDAGSILFPLAAEDLPFLRKVPSYLIQKEKTIMSRFVFDEKAISRLKIEASSELVVNPSRSEVIAGLIWKCAMASAQGSDEKPSVLANMVNLRPRLKPALSEFSIGNIILGAFSESYSGNPRSLDYLVSLMRKSLEELNPEKFQGQQGGKQILEHLNRLIFSNSIKPSTYVVSSSTKMRFYEVDFGWGRPLWVTVGPALQTFFKNFILLMDTGFDNGIEAWIILNEDEMKKLENNLEFQAYATPNPIIKH